VIESTFSRIRGAKFYSALQAVSGKPYTMLLRSQSGSGPKIPSAAPLRPTARRLSV